MQSINHRPAPPPPTGSSSNSTFKPRVITYFQTHHTPDGKPVSLLPLITQNTGITHIILAAIHLNDDPNAITLNDHPPHHERNNTLWAEIGWVRGAGIRVLGMLGGAAKGSYARLSGSQTQFEAYYAPLHSLIKERHLDGLDLDVEEETSLDSIIRLIDRLRADFGPSFIITLAPVATALIPGLPQLSGFSYFELEARRGKEIGWYNAQFYCGWGDASSPMHYDAVLAQGWRPEKVVMGIVTNPAHGAGYVEPARLEDVLVCLRNRYPGFGGVMGWEYFNALGRSSELTAAIAPGPARWSAMVCTALYNNSAGTAEGQARLARVQAQWPLTPPGAWRSPAAPMVPFPEEDIAKLTEVFLCSRQQAIAALNVTEGNVEGAAGVLFAD